MVNIANIVCKTIGIAGLSAAAYDAYAVGKHHSAVGEKNAAGKLYADVYQDSRTLSSESHVASEIQSKVADFRMNNPIIPVTGKIKGFFHGALNSMGDNIFLVSSAALALGTKGFFSKLGAWGVAGFGLFKILKDGFGIGK